MTTAAATAVTSAAAAPRPDRTRPADVLALQRAAGNAAVGKMLASGRGDQAGQARTPDKALVQWSARQPSSQIAGPVAVPLVLRQTAVTPALPTGGGGKCEDLLQAIIDLLNEVAKRFRDAQDDPHDLFKYHRHLDESHPEHGSWDGHRSKYDQKREELRRKIAEWEADDDCGKFRLSREQQEDLAEAREFGDKQFPTKPVRSLREAEESEQESIWDKLRKPLPDWVVKALIALGAVALAVVLVVAFATGAGEIALALAGIGLVLGLAIKAAVRAAGIRDTSGDA
ncbi:hypothetical protein ACFYWX_29450 [Streptomyces sp. NPDC002888]|uniref:hypothetical protein n=1 Tax=Streptomyces sp. NPDC002888 TaxID=3364668 RepID=UPI0036C2F09A